MCQINSLLYQINERLICQINKRFMWQIYETLMCHATDLSRCFLFVDLR